MNTDFAAADHPFNFATRDGKAVFDVVMNTAMSHLIDLMKSAGLADFVSPENYRRMLGCAKLHATMVINRYKDHLGTIMAAKDKDGAEHYLYNDPVYCEIMNGVLFLTRLAYLNFLLEHPGAGNRVPPKADLDRAREGWFNQYVAAPIKR